MADDEQPARRSIRDGAPIRMYAAGPDPLEATRLDAPASDADPAAAAPSADQLEATPVDPADGGTPIPPLPADTAPDPAPDPVGRGHSPAVAAFLSFLWPGAGQAWVGRAMRAALFALPVLFLVGIPFGLFLTGGVEALSALVLQPGILLAIIVLDIVLLAWRGVAIVDGYRTARRANAAAGAPGGRRGTGMLGKVVVALLVVATIGTHGAIAYVGYNGYDLVTGVFASGNGEDWGDAEPSYTPDPEDSDDPNATPDPLALATPSPSPLPTITASPTITPEPLPVWAQDGRLNLVLLGGDAGPGRTSIRTDTMMLLTVDLETNQAALFGFPRNLLNVPLPKPYSKAFPNGRFPGMLNALWRYADEHPSSRFPGGDKSRGFRAVTAAIGYMAGVDVDGMAYVDLNGFVKFIDVLGGLTINVPYSIYDAKYPKPDGSGYKVVSISPGKHHFDGEEALEYARSRHQDSDYGRMERQQLVLVALRRQTKVCSLVTQLPKLVKIAKSSMYTNIPLNDLTPFIAVASKVRGTKIIQVTFSPGDGYPEFVTTSSVLKMRKAVKNVFRESAADTTTAPGLGGLQSAPPTDEGLDLPDLSC